MPICQFLITSANNGSYFDVPFSGTCNMKLLNIQYEEKNNNPAFEVIQILSDQVYAPQSPLRYITLFHTNTLNINYDSAHAGYNFKGIDLRGRVQFNVVEKTSQAQPAHFVACLLTFDIEDLTQPAPR